MAARRLLIIMLVLLAISTVLALVVPSRSPRNADRSTSTSTTETTPRPDPTLTPDITGKVVSAHFDFLSKTRNTVDVHRGDQLILSVTGSTGDDIEIPHFGLTETVTPYAPAVFNLIVDESGTFPIRAVGADLVVGRIVSTNP